PADYEDSDGDGGRGNGDEIGDGAGLVPPLARRRGGPLRRARSAALGLDRARDARPTGALEERREQEEEEEEEGGRRKRGRGRRTQGDALTRQQNFQRLLQVRQVTNVVIGSSEASSASGSTWSWYPPAPCTSHR
ncbi:unnamed protein product, partial [Prorocentrum cordatum]